MDLREENEFLSIRAEEEIIFLTAQQLKIRVGRREEWLGGAQRVDV